MNKIKVFTAFSGYDSQCMALERAGIPYELVGWSEIDRNAIRLHDACFPQYAGQNYGDISKIDWNEVPDFDLFTYSFPCQSVSSAGTQKGLAEGSGTASSLLWECRKAIKIKRPQFLLMENVKALTHKKFLPYLRKWQDELAAQGYDNYTKVLNARDYGVPQNRERVFMVSVLHGTWKPFHFPAKIPLRKCLADILENNVDKHYYLSDKMIAYFNRTSSDNSHNHCFKPFTRGGKQIAFTVTAMPGNRVDDNFIVEPLGATHVTKDPNVAQAFCANYYKSGTGKNAFRTDGFGYMAIIEKHHEKDENQSNAKR